MQTSLLIDIYRPLKNPQKIPTTSWEYADDFGAQLQTQKACDNVVWVPQFSAHVSCGLFGISDDYIEKYQSLDSRFIKNKAATFFFTAASDSMQPLIMEGDVLVVDRSVEAVSGKVVVASVGGEMLCKRLKQKDQQIFLCSENPSYQDLLVTEEMDLVIFGVVTSIAREII